MDYSKYRYDMMKREKEQTMNQKVIEIKEIRLSATIDVHDMEVKAKQCEKFLSSGNKVKVTIRFRGRQITKGEMGEDVMTAFFDMLNGAATMERAPKQEGRNMFMVLAPKN
jgi:translation initiation factor IF-3